VGLYPLQLGDSNSIFIVIVVVVLVGIIIGLILTVKRRVSAMSEELSKQSKDKFEAIVPTSISASRNDSRVTDVKEKAQPLARTDHLRETAGDFTLRKEVFETKLRLEQFIRENTRHMEKERQSLAEIEKLRTEVSSLQERLNVNSQEVHTLKASLAEHGIKLHNQTRDIENQSSQVELKNLKTNLDDQNSERRHALDSEAPARVIEVADRPEIAPPMRLASDAIYPGTQVALGSSSNKCLSCGFTIKPRDNFCMHCGHSVN
jgi:chromosome segregation ATPase